ncbi:MAG: long-chain fatty acid--CoA ligase [Gammaproteobacteria bacterium]|nr:long-chain fatty acid--CoA ligase [Gammaproteobacteria bacterium]MDH5593849.1 long-chain fatty acid--CoA ligase [Gammaproteobacteria bacterium]
MSLTNDMISINTIKTLDGAFLERVRRTPDSIAYRQFDEKRQVWVDATWAEMAVEVGHWQAAIGAEGVVAGDRVAIMIRNSREWVVFEQAALGLGLVIVPLYINDRAGNISYIINDADVKLLLIGGSEQWEQLKSVKDDIAPLKRIIYVGDLDDVHSEPRMIKATEWLFGKAGVLKKRHGDPNALASIVYTSGTTGRPKGVMLSHYNILWNAWAGTQHITVYAEDLFLSILPLSHMLERTAGYYIPMMAGSTVAFARSVETLSEDLQTVAPTMFISVPRIFERALSKIQAKLATESEVKQKLVKKTSDIGWHYFEYKQGRASWSPKLLLRPILQKIVASKIAERLGGRLRIIVCGGAPLPEYVSHFFIGMGLELQQGYGLTETSPVISVNPVEDNDPESVGTPLTDVEIKKNMNGELMTKSPGVMMGYWNNESATQAMIDPDGWLHTGDIVRIENNHIYITGRLKEIIVMSNGEKVPPADMESAILCDPLFEQVIVFGEGMSRLGAIIVLNKEHLNVINSHSSEYNDSMSRDIVNDVILKSINNQLSAFPGYARVEHVIVEETPWTIEDGYMTPTLKLKRNEIMKKHEAEISHFKK